MDRLWSLRRLVTLTHRGSEPGWVKTKKRKRIMRANFVFLIIVWLTASGGPTESFARPPRPLVVADSAFSFKRSDGSARLIVVSENDYQADINRLIALRSHPLNELIGLANQLEAKWRQVDWNSYARIMIGVCSEISNRGLNNEQIREHSERFARIALSHSHLFLWEHESMLVGWLGYQRSDSDVNVWLRERREKAKLWLHALQRLEKETDPRFNINNRKNLPSMRVSPPSETGLPAGTPPSSIKDPHLRAKYEAAIAENKRKSKRVDQQLPLLLHGPQFKTRAERWLIQAYSQPPVRTAELRRYLTIFVQDEKIRQRILSEVEKNSKSSFPQ